MRGENESTFEAEAVSRKHEERLARMQRRSAWSIRALSRELRACAHGQDHMGADRLWVELAGDFSVEHEWLS